jgi:D-lactate dehydrogenase
MRQTAGPCALEFMDGTAISLVRGTVGESLPENAGALLLIEVDGSEAGVDADVKTISDAASLEGILALDTARTDNEVKTLWAARKALSPSLRKAAAGKINEDVVVPVSRMPELVDGLTALADEYGILIVNFGHAGNGNLHVNLLFDPNDERQSTASYACLEEVFDLVIGLDGTLSGEHGVGLAKRDFIQREIGDAALDIMRGIKRVFDPRGTLNPGKLLPPE